MHRHSPRFRINLAYSGNPENKAKSVVKQKIIIVQIDDQTHSDLWVHGLWLDISV